MAELSAMQRRQKITLGEMRSGNGPNRLYCSDYKCAHSIIINSERWPDHVRLSDLEPKFTCKACGQRGADVRPLFEKSRDGNGKWLGAFVNVSAAPLRAPEKT
jgi:hypothetical protein